MVPDHADQARRLIVRSLSLRNFRSYEALELRLEAGLVLVTGPNGAGKTNLLEAVHVGGQGFSPRTRADAELVRFGADFARVQMHARRGTTDLDVEVLLRRGEGKRARVNGAALPSPEGLRSRAAVLAFTPDRLAVVKGGPAVRRAYFDRALGRLAPARATVPAEYGAALSQRNASLRRAAAGIASREAIEPWSARVVELAAVLIDARRGLVAALDEGFGERGRELGLGGLRLRYEGEPPSAEELERRLDRDLRRGSTGAGPHRDEFAIRDGTRELRSFGSQGEQRLAVLSLVLAEADALAERHPAPPLLLLDDVLSELDANRRRLLVERLTALGQTVVTATSRDALPAEPAQLVAVEPGIARSVRAVAR